jgi:hypothetical protein
VLSKQRALSTQCPSPSRHSVLSASIVCGMGAHALVNQGGLHLSFPGHTILSLLDIMLVRWTATIGRVLLATGYAWEGSVRVRGHVTDRASQCLPSVRSRTCVDTWASVSSSGSFKTVSLVTV